VVLVALALVVFWRQLHGLSVAQFTAAIAQWSHKRIALALLMVTASYLLLALNEQIGLRWVGGRVKLVSGVAASFIAHALANNLGMGVVAGGALRISVFTRYGISLVQVAKLTAYGTSTFSLGVATLGGISLLTAKDGAFAALHLEPLVGHGLGVLLILVPVAYGLACTFAPDGMTLFGHEFRPPRLGVAITQILFGMADVALGGALFWLLIGPSAPPYVTFLTTYLLSLTTGLVSGVPGGVGVFESGMLLLLPASVNRSVLMAALLGYRLFYYLAPLGVALVLLLTRRPRPSDGAAQG
jgi:phosphatidylglycerol lysyltransferase